MRYTKRLQLEQLECRRMLAPYIVDNIGDGIVTGPGDQPGTLRQAIFDANFETLGPDTITFDPTVFDPTDGMMDTIVLTEGQLTITDALTINGPGWDELTIDASHPVVFTQAA